MEKTLTTKEAAEQLGVSVPRVRQMILSGSLPAEKFGRDLVVKEADLVLVSERKPGRPPKPKPAATELAASKPTVKRARTTKASMKASMKAKA